MWELSRGFGLATQEPWIQFATIRDNILFGKMFDAHLYKEVLEACALNDDLSVSAWLPAARVPDTTGWRHAALGRGCLYSGITHPGLAVRLWASCAVQLLGRAWRGGGDWVSPTTAGGKLGPLGLDDFL